MKTKYLNISEYAVLLLRTNMGTQWDHGTEMVGGQPIKQFKNLKY